MVKNPGRLLVAGYSLLLAIAFGGFVGANLAGFIPGFGEFFLNPDNRATPPNVYRSWIHRGWLTGAALATAVGLVHTLRRRSTAKSKGTGHTEPSRRRPRARLRHYRSPKTVLGSAAVGGLAGGFLGMLLGSTLLFFWFSLSYSPFAPAEWGASIGVERVSRPERGFGETRLRHTTNQPIGLFLFVGPTLTGLIAGGGLGGIGKFIEK